jgi:hypothetical protein
MVHEQSEQVTTRSATATKAASDGLPRQAITGLTPPEAREALIRETWPSLTASSSALCGLASRLIRSVFLAPLGWMLLAPLLGKKFSPFLARRYTLTNRRLMIQHGLRPTPGKWVSLADIDDVRLEPNSLDNFYRCGNLEVISKGQVVLRLPGVPEAEGFRHAIINAVKAWVPSKANGPFVPASAAKA